MIPRRLQIQGFLSYRDPVDIDFDGVSAIAIVGDNGAGKTSLVEAIAWALFGEGRGRGPDDFVNAMSTLARVTFDFQLGADLYRVHRERDRRGKGKSALYLLRADVFAYDGMDQPAMDFAPIGGDHMAEVQASICDLVGLTYDQWITTSYIAQGRADAFTRLTPAGRKDLLAQILDLDRFRTAERAAKTATDEAAGQLGAISRRLADIEHLIIGEADVQKSLDEAAQALEDATARQIDLRGTLEGLQERQLAARQAADQVRRLDEERKRVVRDLDEAEVYAGRIPDLEDREAAAASTEASAVADLNDVIQTNATCDAEVTRLLGVRRAELAAIEDADARVTALGRPGAVCPVCGGDLDPKTRETLLEDARRALAFHQGALAATDDQIHGYQATRADQKTAQTSLDRARATLIRVREDLMEARQLASTVQDRKESLVDVEARLNAALEDMGEDQAGMIEDARVELADVEGDRSILAERIGGLKMKMGVIADARRERDYLFRRRDDLHQTVGDHRVLQEAFGDTGIPALIIEAAVPAVEAEANQILAKLAPRFTVAFRSQKALKTGGIRETLDVIVADDIAERPLESLSGGERQAVDLAVRIGLGRMVAHRRARRIQTLFLDEAFTALDAGRRQATVEVIHGLVGEFDQVWFVTHDRDIAGAFPRTVYVDQVNGTSNVSYGDDGARTRAIRTEGGAKE